MRLQLIVDILLLSYCSCCSAGSWRHLVSNMLLLSLCWLIATSCFSCPYDDCWRHLISHLALLVGGDNLFPYFLLLSFCRWLWYNFTTFSFFSLCYCSCCFHLAIVSYFWVATGSSWCCLLILGGCILVPKSFSHPSVADWCLFYLLPWLCWCIRIQGAVTLSLRQMGVQWRFIGNSLRIRRGFNSDFMEFNGDSAGIQYDSVWFTGVFNVDLMWNHWRFSGDSMNIH